MALKLGVIIYSGAGRADEVLTGFQELHPNDAWVGNIGVIERHKMGRISVYGPFGDDGFWSEEGGKPLMGLSTGGLTGVLIGALAGPAGLAAGGAFGAAMGGLVGAADEDDVDRPMFDVIRAKLSRDSSALVLLADKPFVDQLITAMGKDAKEVYQQDVREGLRGRLDEALREAASYPVAQPKQVPSQPPVH
jgi:uncharacterized membrane protein